MPVSLRNVLGDAVKIILSNFNESANLNTLYGKMEVHIKDFHWKLNNGYFVEKCMCDSLHWDELAVFFMEYHFYLKRLTNYGYSDLGI